MPLWRCISSTRATPKETAVCFPFQLAAAERCLSLFRSAIPQKPPQHSTVWHGQKHQRHTITETGLRILFAWYRYLTKPASICGSPPLHVTHADTHPAGGGRGYPLLPPLPPLRHILVRLDVVPPVRLEVAALAKPIPPILCHLERRVKALVSHEAVTKLVTAVPVRNEGGRRRPKHPQCGEGKAKHEMYWACKANTHTHTEC